MLDGGRSEKIRREEIEACHDELRVSYTSQTVGASLPCIVEAWASESAVEAIEVARSPSFSLNSTRSSDTALSSPAVAMRMKEPSHREKDR